ncbi:MAG: carbohydrate porin, partial [Hydrococcus sp. RU_2_2]|nr:carbohydrate porin [Hydrococcus sp. RU_2_2]
LIQENVAVLKEDIDTLKRLAQEFEAELAALGGRVDNLEARVSFLEDHQFSTTTKLKGEVIFSVADTFGDFADGVDDDDDSSSRDDGTQTVLQDRVRLNFETSFTGEDLLRTRLQAGNFSGGNRFNNDTTGTNMTRLAYDDGTDNDVTINDLWYRFPVGESLTVWAGPSGLDLDDVFSTVNPYLADSGVGSLSRYARYNNMVNRGPGGAGAGAKFEIGEKFYVAATYLADGGDAPDPSEGNGLFNGSFSTGGQIGFLPTEDIELAATYVYSYRTAGSDGLFGDISSSDAEFPFGEDVPTAAHRIGLSASWKITEIIHLGASGGYGTADAKIGDGLDRGGADLWTWNANVSFLDLGKEGAVLSLSGGLPPKGEYIIDGDVIGGNNFRRVDDQSYIIQAQYKFPINDNIFITPGAYVVLNPNHDDNNDPLWVGVIRTTFKF